MRPRVKRFPVTFSARLRADLEDFVPVEVLAEFAKTGCPVKKNVLLTIAFCFCLFCGNYKVKTKRAGSSSEEPAIFLAIILPDTNNKISSLFYKL